MIPKDLDLTVNKYLSRKIENQEDNFRERCPLGTVPWRNEPKTRISRRKHLNRFNNEEKNDYITKLNYNSDSNDSWFRVNNNVTSSSTMTTYIDTNEYTITDGNTEYTFSNISVYGGGNGYTYIKTPAYVSSENKNDHKYSVTYEDEDDGFHFPDQRKIKEKFYKCQSCGKHIPYPHGLCDNCKTKVLKLTDERIPWDEESDDEVSQKMIDRELPWKEEIDRGRSSWIKRQTYMKYGNTDRVPWDEEDDDMTVININVSSVNMINSNYRSIIDSFTNSLISTFNISS